MPILRIRTNKTGYDLLLAFSSKRSDYGKEIQTIGAGGGISAPTILCYIPIHLFFPIIQHDGILSLTPLQSTLWDSNLYEYEESHSRHWYLRTVPIHILFCIVSFKSYAGFYPAEIVCSAERSARGNQPKLIILLGVLKVLGEDNLRDRSSPATVHFYMQSPSQLSILRRSSS